MDTFDARCWMQGGGYVFRKNARCFETQNRADAFSTSKYAVAHRRVNRSWRSFLRRQQPFQRGVYRQAIFFKEIGKFHRGRELSKALARYRAERTVRIPSPLRDRKVRLPVFRRLSLTKSRRGLPLPRVASGIHARVPRLLQTMSSRRPAKVADSRACARLLLAAPATARNQAFSRVQFSSLL